MRFREKGRERRKREREGERDRARGERERMSGGSRSNMAAVYSEEQPRLRINDENVSSENEKDWPPESSADLARCDKELSVENSSVGRALRAGRPAPQAQEHADVEVLGAAVPPIRIKEEPVEESEYLTVHVADVEEENWEEQSGRDERADGKWLVVY